MAKGEIFISSVKQGKLSKNVSDQIKFAIDKCEGGKVIITVGKFSSKRSLPQNSYLHLLFTMYKDALNELGNDFTMEKVKELCKTKFLLTDEVNEDTGEIIGQRVKGTSELNKMEMTEFIDSIIRWASEFHIILPYPNEQLASDLNFERAGL